MIDPANWPSTVVGGVFVAAVIVIGVVGTRLSRIADRLADVTGLGEAVFGALLLGGTTSLPGITASVWSAAKGHPELAVSNALGGIAAQTVFLAVADMSYRRANLEHAAASAANLMQGALCSTLLAVPLIAMSAPAVSWAGVHPISLALIVGYACGMKLVASARTSPMWGPQETPETEVDEPENAADPAAPVSRLWIRFAVFALTIAGAGYAVAETGIALTARTGLSESVVGALFTAISTSLPELVTSIAAVRQGALTLAVGNIIGGNSFDVLFVAFSDFAYRAGSIYHAIPERLVFMIALAILLTNVLLLGLLRREKHGIAGIGFESFLVLVLYLGAVLVLFY